MEQNAVWKFKFNSIIERVFLEEVIPSKMADLKYKESVWFDPEPVGMAMNVTSTGDAFNSVRISAQKSLAK